MDYIFMTDSSCDLSAEIAKEINVEILPMEFTMEDKSYLHYADARMMSLDDFYSKLKSGIDSKTTQINYNNFINYFEPYLKAGKDILYTGICTGLSGTYNTCLMAVKDLQEKYSDRKIVIIDSMCDSVGLGLLIYLAGQNFNLLKNKSEYDIKVTPLNGSQPLTVSAENFILDTENNTADLILDELMSVGTYQIVFDMKDPTKKDITSDALKFNVSDDIAYQGGSYGVVTIEKDGDNKYALRAYKDEKEYSDEVPNAQNISLLELRGDFTLKCGRQIACRAFREKKRFRGRGCFS